MSVAEKPLIPVLELEPAKRCPDYDSDCRYVPNHAACWRGGMEEHGGVLVITEIADGYCPYLLGQDK